MSTSAIIKHIQAYVFKLCYIENKPHTHTQMAKVGYNHSEHQTDDCSPRWLIVFLIWSEKSEMLMQKLQAMARASERAMRCPSVVKKKPKTKHSSNNNNNKKAQRHHRYGEDALDLITTREGDGPVVKREAGL